MIRTPEEIFPELFESILTHSIHYDNLRAWLESKDISLSEAGEDLADLMCYEMPEDMSIYLFLDSFEDALASMPEETKESIEELFELKDYIDKKNILKNY